MTIRQRLRAAGESTTVFLRDVGQGLLEVSHNSLALLGLAVVAVLAFALGHADLRRSAELEAFSWLQARHEARAEREGDLLATISEPEAIVRATAADPGLLTRQQAAVARWLARRYKVAPEPVSRLVQEAWQVGAKAGLDPTLILAIMAIESSFNPFAQSTMGAQGLMQVMTTVHDDKYEAFGGNHAAFDPITNLRVGVQVLKECIARAGGLEAGLRFYVGAANLQDDGGYAGRVLAEQSNLKLVAGGKGVSINAPIRSLPVPVPAAAAASTVVPPALEARDPAPATDPAADAAPADRVAMR